MTLISKYPAGTAARHALAQCDVCRSLTTVSEAQYCQCCHSKLSLRHPDSIQRTLAFIVTAILFYIPANLLPIMNTETLGRVEAHTIAEGVIIFWQQGSYPIAIVIFCASLLIPLAKILALLWLCWFVSKSHISNQHQLARVYHFVEFIGKWSMVDVFVVSLMVALVQMGELMRVTPGAGATSFAAVVIFTILAARAFDVRLIWDRQIQ